MSKRSITPEEVAENRALVLSALRSGKYRKGTIKSDERGRPVVESEADEGWCACALMHDLFFDYRGWKHKRAFMVALNLKARQCRYIQQELNDTPLTFPEIADLIEVQIFNGTDRV